MPVKWNQSVPLEDGVPVELGGVGLLNGGVGPVVDADTAALGRALFQEVDAHPVAAADDLAGVHTEVAEGVHRRLTDGVLGQLGDVSRFQAEIGQGDGHVGLAAAEGGLHLVILEEPE